LEVAVELDLVEAVLFDMDGTLVDSDAAVERAWRTWSAEYGADPEAVIAFAHGRPAEQTVRRMLPQAGDDVVAEAAGRQLALQYEDLSDVVATPGASDVPAALAALGLPWAVVTSADDRLAEARLGAAGIVAPVLVTVDRIVAGKPDPEGYLLAAKLLGADPARCLVVEDAAVGVTAGRAAGAMTAGLKGVDADLPIAGITELLKALIAAKA
jgi:sugar-phosphatase